MSPRTGWPYATKAIFQHEFDTDHLNVWVIFKFSMNITIKPPNAKWKVEADGVPKAINASAWQDMWTLLLTVPAVGARPNRVTVEYDGPDLNLVTTWDKQWEAFGPILSEDKTLIVEIVPGMVLMWYGTLATIPSGYQLCDGTNGTPDLRNQFLVGGEADKFGVPGTMIEGALFPIGGGKTHIHTTVPTSHAIDEGDANYVSVVTGIGSNIPPFYAIYFIMKM